jgi:hypothetical protein
MQGSLTLKLEVSPLHWEDCSLEGVTWRQHDEKILDLLAGHWTMREAMIVDFEVMFDEVGHELYT